MSTNIILPFHVTTDKIVMVIAKVVGCSFSKDTHKNLTAGKNYGKKEPFNPDLPITEENKWHIVFDSKEVYYSHSNTKDSVSVNLHFKDLADQSHSWFTMVEDAQYEEGKRVLPDSTVISVAVAKRLVDFFGGYADLNSERESDPTRIYKLSKQQQKKIKYPHVKIDPEDYTKTNYRWNLFYNALNNEPVLTIKELEAAKQYASYFTDKDEALYNTLSVLENHENLTNKINNIEIKSKETQSKLKI